MLISKPRKIDLFFKLKCNNFPTGAGQKYLVCYVKSNASVSSLTESVNIIKLGSRLNKVYLGMLNVAIAETK